MSVPELAALHQGHGVGIHLADVLPVVLGQAHDAVADAQLVFAHDGESAGPQQLVVVQQTARYGVLYGHHSHGLGVFLHVVEHLLEGIVAGQFYFLFPEVAVGRYVVETSLHALYRYVCHFRILFFVCKKMSRLLGEAGHLRVCCSIFFCLISSRFMYATARFTSVC